MSRQSVVPATTYPSIVGVVIADLRKKAGLDQRKMAESVHVTQSTWSRIETGKSALTMEQLADAAAALKKSPSEILHYADQTRKKFEEQGVAVTAHREDDGLSPGHIIIGVAAIAALVALVLSKK